jgi:hypothetical protein
MDYEPFTANGNGGFPLNCPYCSREIDEASPAWALGPFKVLFDASGNPRDMPFIKSKLADFGESYDRVARLVISGSTNLDEDTFRFNVATLMPSFGMTRRGVFYGVRIERGIPKDPNHVLDACWAQVKDDLPELKKHVNENVSSQRNRALLELSPKSRNYVVAKTSQLFDRLEWTAVKGSDVGPVAASKILFAVLPEIALPVDNSEWNHVFRTHNYSIILSTMIYEISEWEKKSKTSLETLDPNLPTTLPSIYNVMAMAARPPAGRRKKKPVRKS